MKLNSRTRPEGIIQCLLEYECGAEDMLLLLLFARMQTEIKLSSYDKRMQLCIHSFIITFTLFFGTKQLHIYIYEYIWLLCKRICCNACKTHVCMYVSICMHFALCHICMCMFSCMHMQPWFHVIKIFSCSL